MKKKILIVLGVVVSISIITCLILSINNKVTYRVEVSLVDDKSPDRYLTVYNNKNEKIEVRGIEFLDGVKLCDGYNLKAYYGDIEDVKELRLVLMDNQKVVAQVVEKEVNK